MMASPATFPMSNFPREYAPWMDTITSRGEQVLGEESPQHTGISPLPTGAYVITASMQVNPTIASQVITIDAKGTSGWSTSFLLQHDIITGSIPQMTVTSSLNEFRLVTLGMQLAKILAHTLDQIRVYNRLAIYPIVSILEPYLEEAEELVLDMSPISSIRSIARIIDRETAESKGTDVQGESFFRFLDELESGAYAADDITDEE